ncbi:hypothetical protein, partial [Methylocystis sp.]|uniref:hypothetical protein n=1 Tax=Methylocystis sp. TaxID=1911079 RepID=UPI002733CA17
VKGRAGGGVLRQALSLKLSNDQSKKSGSPEGPTLNRRSSENDRYEMKIAPIWQGKREKSRNLETDRSADRRHSTEVRVRATMSILPVPAYEFVLYCYFD